MQKQQLPNLPETPVALVPLGSGPAAGGGWQFLYPPGIPAAHVLRPAGVQRKLAKLTTTVNPPPSPPKRESRACFTLC
jgi:hypothetical protein